jgi:hypothetical protein
MAAFLAQLRRRWLLGSLGGLGLVACLVWWLGQEDNLNVPLGVEQAAIITYSGPGLVVKPYRWGVAVNVRIAQVTDHGASRVYDVRYLVNREGDHDLIEYLMTDNGSSLSGLPSFKVHGDPKLSKELEARVKETEDVGIEVRGHYRATLAALFIGWIGWLFLLIFYGRPRKLATRAEIPAPTVVEQLRGLLTQLEAGELTAKEKARLEMLLLRCWREGLVAEDAPMGKVLAAIARGDRTREALDRLQHWLHRPASGVAKDEITALIRAQASPPPAAARP